jgi:RimJ/RimL family protein N-acetyltransferase
MKVEFRRADTTSELRSLMIFDRKVFGADAFSREMWSEMDAWWMLVDAVKTGCSAFEPHVGFDRYGEPTREPGTLYIATTGILPRRQGRGLGLLMKAWQVAWARSHSYRRIVTNHRAGNQGIIAMNKAFGFRRTGRIKGYYSCPDEDAISMILELKQ